MLTLRCVGSCDAWRIVVVRVAWWHCCTNFWYGIGVGFANSQVQCWSCDAWNCGVASYLVALQSFGCVAERGLGRVSTLLTLRLRSVAGLEIFKTWGGFKGFVDAVVWAMRCGRWQLACAGVRLCALPQRGTDPRCGRSASTVANWLHRVVS